MLPVILMLLFITICVGLIAFMSYSIWIKDSREDKKSKYEWEYKEEIIKQRIVGRYEVIFEHGCNKDIWRFCYYKDGSFISLNGYFNDKVIINDNTIWSYSTDFHTDAVKIAASRFVDKTIKLHKKS